MATVVGFTTQLRIFHVRKEVLLSSVLGSILISCIATRRLILLEEAGGNSISARNAGTLVVEGIFSGQELFRRAHLQAIMIFIFGCIS